MIFDEVQTPVIDDIIYKKGQQVHIDPNLTAHVCHGSTSVVNGMADLKNTIQVIVTVIPPEEKTKLAFPRPYYRYMLKDLPYFWTGDMFITGHWTQKGD